MAIGIRQSIKKADPEHPYGYSNLRHVFSLISGVGIFFFGTGISFYHGVQGLVNPHPLEPMGFALLMLSGSFLSESATLVMAYGELRKKAKAENKTVARYVWEGNEPSLNVVLLEDLAAVGGVTIAAGCLGLSLYINSTIPDALGSMAVGGLLGAVASFIVYSNSNYLVGK